MALRCEKFTCLPLKSPGAHWKENIDEDQHFTPRSRHAPECSPALGRTPSSRISMIDD
jgi:hypothetical protein